MVTTGTVSLVGAGPGDPELITWKGLKRLRSATVVIYDRLIANELLTEAPQARQVYAGKAPYSRGQRPDASTVTGPGSVKHQYSITQAAGEGRQQAINRTMIQCAEQGEQIVRLKGGDPFIFGRGGEEVDILLKSGVPVEVIPGVTSAIAAPGAAGIPLTHRDHAGSVAFLTGHRRLGNQETHRWQQLAKGADSLVLLMSVGKLKENLRLIHEAGRSSDTPAAAVHWGTTEKQQVIRGTLGNLADRANAAGLKPPAVIVVGAVASFARQRLNMTSQVPGKKPLKAIGKEIHYVFPHFS